MNIPDWFSVESEDPKLMSKTDLRKIHEIEQDMWAEWIGEYVKCNSCQKILSKKNIFWHLSKDIYMETVWQIEQILAIDSIKCSECNSLDTSHIWWEKYISEIEQRYNDTESFITSLRDSNGEIRWFIDWYINDINTIYKREFEYYYSDIWINKIKEKIEFIIWNEIPNKLLMNSTIWLEVKYSNLNNFLIMLNIFYISLLWKWYWNILWIYESRIWSMAHAVFYTCWWKSIWLNDFSEININNLSDNSISDVFVHPNIVSIWSKELSISLKDFLKNNLYKMKEVLSI